MKSLPIIVIFVLATASSQVNSAELEAEHDGRPGCNIRYEFRRLWRNNFVPEQYWECTTWRQPAEVRHCPPATRFQDSWQTCVPISQWQWTPYSDPPTRPCEEVDECEEVVIRPEEPEAPDECPLDPNTTTSPWVSTTEGGSTGTTEGGSTGTTEGGSTGTTEGGGGGTDIDPNGTCVGATDGQHEPGTMSCFAPECTLAQWKEGTLYPTRDPNYFYQCGPGIGNLFIRRCAPGTCFSFRNQVCVHIRKWRNDCG